MNDTRTRILDAGVSLWRDDPWSVTPSRIAAELQLTHTAVFYHFGCVNALRHAVAQHAVDIGDSRVVVQLIAMCHPAVAGMAASAQWTHFGCLPG